MVDEVDDALSRVQREGWVPSVPVSHGLVNLCDKRFETVLSLEVECDDPVRCEWGVGLEGPEETDKVCDSVSSILSGGPSNHSKVLCVRDDLRIHHPLLSCGRL